MKLKKYTFKSPLFGSISCEEIFSDMNGCSNGAFDVSASGMSTLYNQGRELQDFLDDNKEDLVEHIPESLEGLIFKAEFGDYDIADDMFLLTHIWAKELNPLQIEELMSWITGQMSDGWGEGLEQRAWKTERVERKFTSFDEYTLEFEEDAEFTEAYYYVSPWNSEDFELDVKEEDVEMDIPVEMRVMYATSERLEDGRFFIKNLIEFDDASGLLAFLKEDYSQSAVLSFIEKEAPFGGDVKYYLVSQGDGVHIEVPFRLGIKDENVSQFYLYRGNKETGEVNKSWYELGDEVSFKLERLG